MPIKFQHFAPFLAKNFVQQMSNPFGAAGGANGRKWPLLAKYGPFLAKNAEILWVQGWTILYLTNVKDKRKVVPPRALSSPAPCKVIPPREF